MHTDLAGQAAALTDALETARPALHIVTLPHPAGAPLAELLWSVGQARLPDLGGGPARGWVADFEPPPAASVTPEVLVLAAHPGYAVAAALASGADPATSLSDWQTGVRRLLRLAHKQPERFLFIDMDEAASAVDRMVQALARWHAAFASLLQVPTPLPAGDTVLMALGHAIAGDSRGTMELRAELLATCIPLLDDEPESRSIATWAAAAAREHLGLRSAAQVAAAAQQRLDQALRDGESTSRQLRDALASLDDARRISEELRQAQRDSRSQVLSAETALQASRAGEQLLTLQLQHAQEELELMGRQVRNLERQVETGVGLVVRAADVVVLSEVDAPPHCHLHLCLEQLRLGPRVFEAAEVRLVDHSRHPGLALFAGRNAANLLAAWQPNGTEEGRDFVLLVPDDESGRETLLHLGTSDWQTVRALVSLLVELALTGTAGFTPRWLSVALRLEAQLAAMPERVRYDATALAPDEVDSNALIVTLSGAVFGRRQLGAVRLRWRPSEARLAWLAPLLGAAVPLPQWPVTPDGFLLRELDLPVGDAFVSQEKRQRWAALTAADRTLLLGLLDALVAVAANAPANLGAGLSHAAGALRRDARRCVVALRRHSVMRRLLGRSLAGD